MIAVLQFKTFILRGSTIASVLDRSTIASSNDRGSAVVSTVASILDRDNIIYEEQEENASRV